jgi:hypothetical protein
MQKKSYKTTKKSDIKKQYTELWDSHNGVIEDVSLLWCDAVLIGKQLPMLPTSSLRRT